ncbi:MAG: DUF5615 family PIN-like protein [Planctomycetota bacterium]
MAIQFLIDECLHVSLPALAHGRQYAAAHVVHVGLGGSDDEDLLARMLQTSEVLCTNNARDFTGVLGREVHPGLVVFEENTFTEVQQRLFAALLEHVAGRDDLVNTMIFLSLDAETQKLHAPAYERKLTDEEKQRILRLLVPQIREEKRPPL